MTRALVMSGGGSKGSFTAGAVKYLMQDIGRTYDVYCGVSVGALNASYLSMFKAGEEKQASERLLDIWKNISTEQVYKSWFPFGRLHALWEKSVYNSKPLQDKVHNELDLNLCRASGKEVRVGAVSLDTGIFTLFSQNDDCFKDAVLASSSFPGMLCPVEINGEWYSDGGIKEISPLKAAIDLGVDEVDMILTCRGGSSPKSNYNPKNAIELGERVLDLLTDEILEDDIKVAELYNQLAVLGQTSKRLVKINVIRPDHVLISSSLDFSNDKMNDLIQVGYDTAKKTFVK